MSDAAFPTGAYPGYTIDQLRQFIAEPDAAKYPEIRGRMLDEIARREAVAAGDMTQATPGERLRVARARESQG